MLACRFVFLIVPWLLAFAGCGSSSNILGLTVPDEHRNAFEAMLTEARAAYDRDDLKKAFELTQKCLVMVPESESAAILHGFVNLALAGGDPFQIARAMAASPERATKGEADSPKADSSPESSPPSEGMDALAPLKKVIGLTDERQLAKIATRDDSDADWPIYLPACAEEARANLERLQYLQNAIVVVCAFVDPLARVASDYRQNCTPYAGKRHETARAHILWSFAHLTEALIFQSVLAYGATGESGVKSHLERRALKIKEQPVAAGDLEAFQGQLAVLAASIDTVMPKAGRCSQSAPTTQLRATLHDLLAVEAGFAVIPNLPANMAASVAKAMAKISEQGAASLPEGALAAAGEKLRADLTKGMSQALAEKIEALAAETGSPLAAAQRTQICGTYGEIAGSNAAVLTACQSE